MTNPAMPRTVAVTLPGGAVEILDLLLITGLVIEQPATA